MSSRDAWRWWARIYPLAECALLGSTLAEARRNGLAPIVNCQRVLLLGDGNGRFLATLLASEFSGEVVSCDLSPAMIARARQRVAAIGDFASRVSWIEMDATAKWPEIGRFDGIVAQFFFDNFTDEEVRDLVPQLSARAHPGAVLAVAEFTDPSDLDGAFARWRQNWLLRFLYGAFRLSAGLSARRLPRWSESLAAQGWNRNRVKASKVRVVEASEWSRRD